MADFFKDLDTTDAKQAMEDGDHNFIVEKQRATTERGILIPDHVAVVNANTQEYLGTVGIGWEPVQPVTLYELAEELIGATGGKITGAFNMYGGSVIGVSFELAQREYIENDPTLLNFIMITSFNGTHGIAGHSTTTRLSCMNQCNTSNKVYSLKHTKNVLNRLEVVKQMLRYYENEIAAFDKKMMGMVKSRMNQNAAVEWFKTLFPVPTSQRSENILKNQVDVFIDCLNNGRGSDIVGVRGTCYGAFQALTEYINHYRTIKIHNNREEEEVRFHAVHFGTGNTLAQKGLNSISESLVEFSADDFMIE